jgi:PAS domain S-box-containing protein
MASLSEKKSETFPFAEYIEPYQLTRIFYWFVGLLSLGLIAGIFISLTTHSMFAVTVLVISILPLFVSLFFITRHKFEIAAAFLAVILITAITVVATKGLGIHHLSVVGYPTVLIVASLVLRKRTMIFITLYNILCVAWLVFGELSGTYQPGQLVHSVPGDFFTVAVILILTSIMVRLIIVLLFQGNQRLHRELEERKLAEDQIHKQAARAEALASVSHLLTESTQDRQLTLDTIVQKCANLIGDGASIFLYSPDREYFELAAVYNPDPQAMEVFNKELQARPIHVTEGNYAKVLRECQPVLIPVVPLEKLMENSPERREYYTKLPLYSMMLVPLSVQGHILGIVGMARHQPGRSYTAEDLAFLQDIANRSALSMLNAQLYEEIQQELAERKLTEEKYRNIFENAIDGIFQSTPEGTFLSVNPAMARMYGYESPEAMIADVTDITSQVYVDPRDRDELRRRLDSGEKVREFEMLDWRKDSSTFWTSMNVQSIYDDNGNVLYYEGTIEDVTRRKMADEALRESEERYHSLFNRVLDGVYRSTHDGRFVDVNPAMVKMFGYASREDLLAVDIKKDMYFSPEERERLFLDTHQEKVDIFRMKRKDGSEIWVEDRGNYVHDPAGNVIYHEGILRDVTPRLIAEHDRQQAEDALLNFKKLMDESNDAIFILDPETSQYIYFNARACRLLGYTESELALLSVVHVATHIPDLEVWKQRVHLVEEQNGLIFETKYRRKDGTLIPVEVSAKLLDYLGGKAVIALVRDITERKKAQAEIQKLNDELQKRVHELEAKNNELSQFTYTVSHDLKSPLVTINGFMGYLEQDMATGDVERINRDLQRIQEAVNKMYALLTQLLELSRIGRMMNAPENISFAALVQDALDLVHGQLEAHHVTVHSLPNLPTVHGDRQRLTEVLQNLIENAAKYMGDEKSPLIEIGQSSMDADNKPIFFVRDNGIGIEPEHHERIFGLFNKLDAKSEGTGIGLTLVKKIIEVHGGRIWLESEVGKGSTFYFTLPASG